MIGIDIVCPLESQWMELLNRGDWESDVPSIPQQWFAGDNSNLAVSSVEVVCAKSVQSRRSPQSLDLDNATIS